MTTEYPRIQTFRCGECGRDRWITETIRFSCDHYVCLLCLLPESLEGGANQSCQTCKRAEKPKDRAQPIAPF